MIESYGCQGRWDRILAPALKVGVMRNCVRATGGEARSGNECGLSSLIFDSVKFRPLKGVERRVSKAQQWGKYEVVYVGRSLRKIVSREITDGKMAYRADRYHAM